MDLEYKMKDTLKSSKPQVVRVEFDPPLLGYEEVKPRLLGMKAEADEALGTVRPKIPHSLTQLKPHPPSISHNVHNPAITLYQAKAPQITHFELPFQIWITTSLLLLQIYTSIAPPPGSGSQSFWWLAHTICPGIFPNWFIHLGWAIVIVAHTGEGVYAATLAYKHHMPWHIAVC